MTPRRLRSSEIPLDRPWAGLAEAYRQLGMASGYPENSWENLRDRAYSGITSSLCRSAAGDESGRQPVRWSRTFDHQPDSWYFAADWLPRCVARQFRGQWRVLDRYLQHWCHRRGKIDQKPATLLHRKFRFHCLQSQVMQNRPAQQCDRLPFRLSGYSAGHCRSGC